MNLKKAVTIFGIVVLAAAVFLASHNVSEAKALPIPVTGDISQRQQEEALHASNVYPAPDTTNSESLRQMEEFLHASNAYPVPDTTNSDSLRQMEEFLHASNSSPVPADYLQLRNEWEFVRSSK
jgi:hypothetical protein